MTRSDVSTRAWAVSLAAGGVFAAVLGLPGYGDSSRQLQADTGGTNQPAESKTVERNPVESTREDWDRQAAARYLDDRELYWQGWDRAEKDHGTLCVSCHTQAPYGLARPVLDREQGARALNPAESKMLARIEKRVQTCKRMAPCYSDWVSGAGKEVASRAMPNRC